MVLTCPSCTKKLSIADQQATKPGLKLRCPKCSNVFLAASVSSHPQPGAPATVAPTASPKPAGGKRKRGNVNRCGTHAKQPATRACVPCRAGYCPECVQPKKGQEARPVACASCGGPLVGIDLAQVEIEIADRRATPFLGDLEAILRFPITGLPAIVMMVAVSLFVLLIDVVSRGGLDRMTDPWMLLLSIACFGMLITATLHATMSTTHGKRRFEIPQMAMVDFIHTSFIGVAVLAVTYGPTMLVLLAAGGHKAGVVLALLLLPWAVFYGPMAYLLAATTQAIGEVIMPQNGFALMQVLGQPLYRQLLLVFGGLTLVQWIATAALSFLPFLVYPVVAALQVYCSIAAGAAVGVAADKKAEELGID